MQNAPFVPEPQKANKSPRRAAISVERRKAGEGQNRYRPESATSSLKGAQGFIAARTGKEPSWLSDLRRQSMAMVEQYGLPTPRLERWKYTNLLGMEMLDLPLASKASASGGGAAGANITAVRSEDLPQSFSPLRAVFVDGFFAASLSTLPDGVRVCGSAAAHCESFAALWNNAPAEGFNDQMQWALNSVWAVDGFAIIVPKRMVIEQPIEVLYHSTGAYNTYTRTIVQVEEGASLNLIERHSSAHSGIGMMNAVTAIDVQANARLKHIRLQDNDAQGWMLASTHIRQARDSFYEAHSLSCGHEKLNRHQIWVQIQGQNSECYLNGAQLSSGAGQLETVILMNHEAPHCRSYQDYRHIAADESKAVFQGKVHVLNAAQKTEAFQMSRGLLLSPRAEVNTKPELEIYADDVKCSHGATTGQMDEDALFYMRSRGLDMASARSLLLTAFVMEAFAVLDGDERLGDVYGAMVRDWLDNVLERS